MNRAPITELPDVSRTPLGTVLIEMTGDHAVVLGKALAHYDALTTLSTADLAAQLFVSPEEPKARAIAATPGFTREVWQHTFIDLFVEAVQLRGRVAAVVPVDVQDVALNPPTEISTRRSHS